MSDAAQLAPKAHNTRLTTVHRRICQEQKKRFKQEPGQGKKEKAELYGWKLHVQSS